MSNATSYFFVLRDDFDSFNCSYYDEEVYIQVGCGTLTSRDSVEENEPN